MKEINLKLQPGKSNFIENLTLYHYCCFRVIDLNVKGYHCHSLLVIIGDTNLVAPYFSI